jgi:hypothetical protein
MKLFSGHLSSSKDQSPFKRFEGISQAVYIKETLKATKQNS